MPEVFQDCEAKILGAMGRQHFKDTFMMAKLRPFVMGNDERFPPTCGVLKITFQKRKSLAFSQPPPFQDQKLSKRDQGERQRSLP